MLGREQVCRKRVGDVNNPSSLLSKALSKGANLVRKRLRRVVRSPFQKCVPEW